MKDRTAEEKKLIEKIIYGSQRDGSGWIINGAIGVREYAEDNDVDDAVDKYLAAYRSEGGETA